MPVLKLKEIRESLGMTQSDLAKLSGVSLNNIARLETGNLQNPTISTVKKLAKALGCSIEALFFEKSV